MKANTSTKQSLLKDERGLSTVEYIIILVLIAVAGITGWNTFGGKVVERVDGTNEQFGGDIPIPEASGEQ